MGADGTMIGSTSFVGAEGVLADVYEGARFAQHWTYDVKLDNVGIYDGVLGDEQLEALVEWEAAGNGMVQSFTVVVPEPSAFGLLAGIGALALVASRRRRK